MTDDDEITRKARRDLERLANEGNLSASPLLQSTAKTVSDHFTAADSEQKDPAELWGTRIGRGLAAFAFVGLSIWLYFRLFP